MDQGSESQLLEYLSTLHPGQLPFRVFHEIARLTVTPIYELVPVRRRADGHVEVLLLERPDDDPVWSGLLHTPGTVIRANDNEGSLHSAESRITQELKGAAFASGPHFVEMRFHQVKRGRELALIHWATLLNDPGVGRWVSFDELPANLVDSQRKFIAAAVEHFQRHA